MPVTDRPHIQTFLDYLKYEKRYSVHTLTAYTTDLVDFFDYLEIQFGIAKLKEIKAAFVRSWLAALKEKGLTSKSLNRKISSLKSFFKFHLKTGGIDSTPMNNVISPKISKRLPVFVKEEDTKRLVQTLNWSAEDWKSLNAMMLVTLFYATGMRLSELIKLAEKQIDFSREQVKVLGKGNKERIIPVSKDLLVTIREYQQLKRKEFENAEGCLLVTERGKKLYPRYASSRVRAATQAPRPQTHPLSGAVEQSVVRSNTYWRRAAATPIGIAHPSGHDPLAFAATPTNAADDADGTQPRVHPTSMPLSREPRCEGVPRWLP